MNSTTSTDRRLEDLEIKVAHLEHALQTLSEVLARQQQELDQTRARAQQLGLRVEELGGGSGANATGYEKPPHY